MHQHEGSGAEDGLLKLPGESGIIVTEWSSRKPEFIYLRDFELAASYGWVSDIVRIDDLYFIFRDGDWLRSLDYSEPWIPVEYQDLPKPIKLHSWDDIRRHRDIVYKRYQPSHALHFVEQLFEELRGGPDGRNTSSSGSRPDGRPEFRPGESSGGRPDSSMMCISI